LARRGFESLVRAEVEAASAHQEAIPDAPSAAIAGVCGLAEVVEVDRGDPVSAVRHSGVPGPSCACGLWQLTDVHSAA